MGEEINASSKLGVYLLRFPNGHIDIARVASSGNGKVLMIERGGVTRKWVAMGPLVADGFAPNKWSMFSRSIKAMRVTRRRTAGNSVNQITDLAFVEYLGNVRTRPSNFGWVKDAHHSRPLYKPNINVRFKRGAISRCDLIEKMFASNKFEFESAVIHSSAYADNAEFKEGAPVVVSQEFIYDGSDCDLFLSAHNNGAYMVDYGDDWRWWCSVGSVSSGDIQLVAKIPKDKSQMIIAAYTYV